MMRFQSLRNRIERSILIALLYLSIRILTKSKDYTTTLTSEYSIHRTATQLNFTFFNNVCLETVRITYRGAQGSAKRKQQSLSQDGQQIVRESSLQLNSPYGATSYKHTLIAGATQIAP